ncbi:MAG: alpha/beta hydrolase [Candidatus Pacebacteria bacterium]|nr:alpha/beta hydrolase [Candidatus Paceibacterota bacterium]
MKKIQVLTVHGGMTFKSEKDYLHYLRTKKVSAKKKAYWAPDYLEKALGKRFEIIAPRMPLQDNAKYRDWKIFFERFIPLLKSDFILIGSSLGGVFLAKYLSEHRLPKKALSIYLVCPPFDNSLPGEDLVGGFTLKTDLSLIGKNSKNLYLLFSKDDDVIPVAHADKYRKKIKNACFIVYKNKNGHFNVPKFPEIVKLIKADTQKA